MMTVKHVHGEVGWERIYPAVGVTYGPPGAESKDSGPVVTVNTGAESLRLFKGTIYVMNEHGSTVATYKLGDVTVRKISERYKAVKL